MNPDSTDPVCELFDAALGVPQEERMDFVRRAPYPESVRREVLSLLEHHKADVESSPELESGNMEHLDGRDVLTGKTPSGQPTSFRVLQAIGSGLSLIHI